MDHARTTALVVGGTQGLGLAIARQLAAEGCLRIAITGRDAGKGEAAAAALRQTGADVRFLAGDIARVEDCLRLVDEAAAAFGPLNALAICAASTDRGTLLDTTPQIWAQLMDTNARGPFFLMQGFVRQALAAGIPASIVNIATMSMYCGQSFLVPYAASKAALGTMTRNVANAFRAKRIRCNAIACGWMDTPGEDAIQKRYHDAPDNWLEIAEARQPFGQLIKPEEVAPLATYLLSPRSGVMTGAIIDHDQNVAGSFPE
jgi:NAD(P)-dependent dehydrogenase (short-subunit alcohol dehydrogenase family)